VVLGVVLFLDGVPIRPAQQGAVQGDVQNPYGDTVDVLTTIKIQLRDVFESDEEANVVHKAS
jgi:hypothetical protein